MLDNKLMAQVFERMLELLKDEEHWCKGSDYQPLGKKRFIFNADQAFAEWKKAMTRPEEHQWCLRGALSCATQQVAGLNAWDVYQEAEMAIIKAIKGRSEFHFLSLVGYNDAAWTTYEDIRLLLKDCLHVYEDGER